MTRPLALLAAAMFVGCGDKDADSGSTDTDADTDADGTDVDTDTDTDGTDTDGTDTDTDTSDTDADTDTDTTSDRVGVMEHEGSAVVKGGSYAGTETVSFIGDDGDGEVLCSYELTLQDSAARTDCDNCEWAFDLEVTAASLISEGDPGCADTVGLDADGIAALVGTTLSYGFDPEFFSHAAVVMGFVDGEWKQLDYALFDEETHTFSYDWKSEDLPY